MPRRSSPWHDAGPAPWRWAPCSRRRPVRSRARRRQISTQGANGAPACVTCHGAKGEGNSGFPRLAGLGAKYLTEQLDAMADGGRVSPIMKATAQALDPAQRQAVAATTPPLPAPLDTDKLAATAMGRAAPADTGAWLATRGAWDKNVPACNQCHGPGGIGVGDNFPRWRASRLPTFPGSCAPGARASARPARWA